MALINRKLVDLITIEYLKECSVIDANVDAKHLQQAILDAQEINIQQNIGQKLYEKIMAGVADEDLPDDYKVLLDDYICPALAKWAYYHALPNINYHITNKNIAEKSSDSSQAVELKVVSYMRDIAKDLATSMSQRIVDFIMLNQTAFPEFFNSNTSYTVKPERSNSSSGFYIPGYRRDICHGPNDSIDLRR